MEGQGGKTGIAGKIASGKHRHKKTGNAGFFMPVL
jgi:hypothetical protein